MSEERRESELILTERSIDGQPSGVMQLYHIALAHEDDLPPNILLVGESERAKVVVEMFDDGIKGEAHHREFDAYWGTYHGNPVLVGGTGIGTDNSEIETVELHAVEEYDPRKNKWQRRHRKRNIIRVGTSGSPQADVPLGSLAITSHAIGLDNTGLSYLHPGMRGPRGYPDSTYGVYYTPGDPTARAIFHEARQKIWEATNGVIRPYVSKASPNVVEALERSAIKNGLVLGSGRTGAYTGITTSAPGFFAPQGRAIGRLDNIILPDLQDRLARIRVSGEGRVLRAINNEMEASVLNRLNGEILGDNVGAVCLVIANRNLGEFIDFKTEYPEGVRRACKVALDAIVELAA